MHYPQQLLKNNESSPSFEALIELHLSIGYLTQIEIPEFDAITVCERGEQGRFSSHGFSLSDRDTWGLIYLLCCRLSGTDFLLLVS